MVVLRLLQPERATRCESCSGDGRVGVGFVPV